jgi:hypothetical protein
VAANASAVNPTISCTGTVAAARTFSMQHLFL